MLCSTWNYCMKKVFFFGKSAHVPIVQRNDAFRQEPLRQSENVHAFYRDHLQHMSRVLPRSIWILNVVFTVVLFSF